MNRPAEAEEQAFFEKQRRAVEDHVKANAALVEVIKAGHKKKKARLTPAKEYFEKHAGHNV